MANNEYRAVFESNIGGVINNLLSKPIKSINISMSDNLKLKAFMIFKKHCIEYCVKVDLRFNEIKRIFF